MLDIQTNSTFQRSKLKLAQVDQKRPTFEWLNRSLDSANCLDSDGGQPKQKIWYFKKFNMHPFQISKVFLKLYLWIFNHLFTSSADCAMKKPTVLAGILELWKLLGQTFFCICLFGWQTLFPKQFSKILHDSVKFSDKKTFCISFEPKNSKDQPVGWLRFSCHFPRLLLSPDTQINEQNCMHRY